MSMILATEISQARREAVLATSKILLTVPTMSCKMLQ